MPDDKKKTYDPFAQTRAHAGRAMERARSEIDPARRAGAYLMGVPVAALWGSARDQVLDPAAQSAGDILKFLAAGTGLGSGSGGELPASAKQTQPKKTGSGAPSKRQSIQSNPKTSADALDNLMRAALSGEARFSINELGGLAQAAPAVARPQAPKVRDQILGEAQNYNQLRFQTRMQVAQELTGEQRKAEIEKATDEYFKASAALAGVDPVQLMMQQMEDFE